MFDPENPPELAIERWLNTDEAISLAALKDRVVVLVTFQMLCPGSVEHGLPQAKRLHERFNPEQVVVIGLHSAFEHQDVLKPEVVEAFLAEYHWPFPIALDKAGADGQPLTMSIYRMRGTPTLLLFDRGGRLRRHYFGRPDDIMLAAEIMALALEDKGSPREQAAGIERKIAATLTGANHDHHHHGGDHQHEHCGCDHDHDHDHAHGHHHHAHGEGCQGDGSCGGKGDCGGHGGCGHDHDHAHGHHGHDHSKRKS